jgi:hypothetical protein
MTSPFATAGSDTVEAGQRRHEMVLMDEVSASHR